MKNVIRRFFEIVMPQQEDFTAPEDANPATGDVFGLSDDEQLSIAVDMALAAAVELILIQRAAWNELVDSLDDAGIVVRLDNKASEIITATTERLRAAMRVAGEVIGIDAKTLKELFND